MLQSHSYGPAKDLCKDIQFDEIASENGVDKEWKTLNEREALTAISNAYSDFLYLLSTKRGCNENCQNVKYRFPAAIA